MKLRNIITSITSKIEDLSGKPNLDSDEALLGFMLAGPYIIRSYDTMNNMKKEMGLRDISDTDVIIDLYKDWWVFYFDERDDAQECADTLENYWGIEDADGLLDTLDDLMDSDYLYKAWDYARLVNNATLGFAAGYLTVKQVMDYIEEALFYAQEKYNDWEHYFEDFIRGRQDWNPDVSDTKHFKKIVETMQNDTYSIYKLLPLQIP